MGVKPHEVIKSAFVDAFVHVMKAEDRERFIEFLQERRRPEAKLEEQRPAEAKREEDERLEAKREEDERQDERLEAKREEDERLAAFEAKREEEERLGPLDERFEEDTAEDEDDAAGSASCRAQRLELYALDSDFDGLVLASAVQVAGRAYARIVDVVRGGAVPTRRPEFQPPEHAEIRRRFYSLDSEGEGVVCVGALLEGVSTNALKTYEGGRRISLVDLEQFLRAHARSRNATLALTTAAEGIMARRDPPLVFRGELERSASRAQRRREAEPEPLADAGLDLAVPEARPPPRFESLISGVAPARPPSYIDLGRVTPACPESVVKAHPVMRGVELRICVLFEPADDDEEAGLAGRAIHGVLRCEDGSDAAVDAPLVAATAGNLVETRRCASVVSFECDVNTAASAAARGPALHINLFDTLYGGPIGAASLLLSDVISRLRRQEQHADGGVVEVRCPISASYPTVAGELDIVATFAKRAKITTPPKAFSGPLESKERIFLECT